jgi:Holliday junction resolvasome RuvABC DNA-binding subunit
VQVQAGPVVLEVLVPASDVTELQANLGEELTFHTLFYLQGDTSGGSIDPRLIGFLRADDKRFFEKLITVKGIGSRTALRALHVPVAEIAHAIESKDARALARLPGIGKLSADRIIADLSGKVAAFMGVSVPEVAKGARLNEEDELAIAAMVSPQMGLRRADAEALLGRAKQSNANLKTADELVPEMLRLHAVRQ